MTAKEQQHNFTDLHSNEVISLEHPPVVHIGTLLHLSIAQAASGYLAICNLLREAELTINFDAAQFFKRVFAGPDYKDKFKKVNKNGIAAARIEHTDLSDPYIKDNVLYFNPVLNPRYTAINFAGLPIGAAEEWGSSYVTLKKSLNQLFAIPPQSFINKLTPSENTIAHHLDNLIIKLTPEMLTAVYTVATGESCSNYPVILVDPAYTNPMVNTHILFSKEVKKMYIAKSELPKGLSKIAVYGAITAFKKKNLVAVDYLSDNKKRVDTIM